MFCLCLANVEPINVGFSWPKEVRNDSCELSKPFYRTTMINASEEINGDEVLKVGLENQTDVIKEIRTTLIHPSHKM